MIMHSKKIQVLPLNRVEGDLEIHFEIENGMVSEVRSVGTMYRGFENLLAGRAPLDGLVITPRICGICSTAHLKAAVKALDMIAEVQIPDDAVRVRNLTLMAEQLQNDLRHTFLLFTPDFTSPAYREHSLFEEAVKRYRPLKGETVVPTIRETKKILEIIAILGGQWPHSSFMVPGGWFRFPDRMTSVNVAACWPIFVTGMSAGFWDAHWRAGRMSKPLRTLTCGSMKNGSIRKVNWGFLSAFQGRPNFTNWGTDTRISSVSEPMRCP